MITLDAIDCLMKLGFTRHESILYVTLCREGELTGYEAAKISGIPRSNAYLALAGLLEKGGVYRIESNTSKYTAVPVKELVHNMKNQLGEVFDYLETNIPVRSAAVDSYITISGKAHIINKMKNIIYSSGERIYVSMAPKELQYVAAELKGSVGRGLKVVVITSPGYCLEGAVIYNNVKSPGQIRLIGDGSQVLTGEISGEGESTCLYSRNKNLIQLIKDSLTNEIRLIELQIKK